MPKVQLPSQLTYPCKIVELCVGYGQKLQAGDQTYIVEDATGRTGAIKAPVDGFVTQMPYPPGSVFSKPMVILTMGDVPPADLNADATPPNHAKHGFEKTPSDMRQRPHQEQPDVAQSSAPGPQANAPKKVEQWSLGKAVGYSVLFAAVIPALIGLALVYLPILEGREALMYPMAFVAMCFGAWAGLGSAIRREAYVAQGVGLFLMSIAMAGVVSGFFALADTSADVREDIAEAFGVDLEERSDEVAQRAPETTRSTKSSAKESPPPPRTAAPEKMYHATYSSYPTGSLPEVGVERVFSGDTNVTTLTLATVFEVTKSGGCVRWGNTTLLIDEYSANTEYYAQYPEVYDRFRSNVIALGDTQSNSIYTATFAEAVSVARSFKYTTGNPLYWSYAEALAAAPNGMCNNADFSGPPRFSKPLTLRSLN